MTYQEIQSYFNIELPDYVEDYFDEFIASYDRSKPIITAADVNLVCDATRLPESGRNELLRCSELLNNDDIGHLCGSFMADVLVYKRAPWLNYIEDHNLFTVDGLKPEQLGWVLVAVQLAFTLKTKNPPEDLNKENTGAFNWYSHCCKRDNGYWGISEWVWNMLSAGGCMFVFGILKFCPAQFNGDFAVITDGNRFVSLTANEYFVGKEGELVDCEEKSVGKTSFYEDDDKYIANVVAPDGTVSLTPTEFDKSVWKDYLREGDKTLEIHIPSKIDYSPEAMKESFKEAIEFYKSYYPEHEVKAIACYSWIYSAQLPKVLPPDSKILAVNRAVHILPCIASFGADCQFIRQGTSLQKRIAEECEKGTEFHFAVMYSPLDELETFGKAVE